MREFKTVAGSSVAALAGMIAASSCCLPLGALLAAGGMTAAGNWITALRPYFFVTAAACLGWAIWGMVRARRCERKNPFQMAVVGVASIVVAAMFLLPQQIANVLADLVPTK